VTLKRERGKRAHRRERHEPWRRHICYEKMRDDERRALGLSILSSHICT